MGTSEALFIQSREEEGGDSGVQNLQEDVHEMSTKVDQLDQKLNEVEQFYSSINKKQRSTHKGSSLLKAKEKEKQVTSCKKRQQDLLLLEADASKRMQALTSEFSEILSDITKHEWAGPFLQPVDVVGLQLDDYYEVIKKPMDFSTIKAKMEAGDGGGYNNVREICSDVRLVFKNAIKYNDEKDDVHVMAQTLLKKFEEKWLKLLPKVDEEDRRQKEAEKRAQLDMQLAQEAAHAKMVRELSVELDAVDMHLDQLKEIAFKKCRKMSAEEKRRLAEALTTRLAPEELSEALDIVSQDDPTLDTTGDNVDLEMDNLNHSTLWKLKLFVKDILRQQKSGTTLEPDKNGNDNCNNQYDNTNKRRRSDTTLKTSRKKSKKPCN